MAQTNNSLIHPADAPTAKKVARTTTVHGETLTDEYFWLREKSHAEVIAYLEAENAHTEALMKPSETLRDTLYQEMVARLKETDADVPYRQGDYLYYTRTEQGKQYKIYARRKNATPAAPEEILLDLNEMAKGHTFMAVGAADVSADANLLAYSTDTTGFREYTLFVKDLRTGKSNQIAERASSAAWANDHQTLFYVVDDPTTKRSYRLFRHRLGEAHHELVYEEPDEKFALSVSRSRNRGYIFATSGSHTTSEVRYLAADQPWAPFRLLEPRTAGHEYYVEAHGDKFYLRTNMNGAKNFQLVSVAAADPQRKNWKEEIAHRADVMLEDIDAFARHLVITEREQGLLRLRIVDLEKGETHDIAFAEPAYHAGLSHNKEFETTKLRFNYQSLVTPESVYDYDMTSRARELRKQTPVLGGFDPAHYQSERILATAPDGTRIPVAIVYRKDLPRDGERPLLLQGYGAYGYPLPVTFNAARLSLLNRGVSVAIAHIRGGGEMGKEWHDQGRLLNKKNTFTDFIAAAEHLIAEQYTSADRLLITGGSAGGLLMGAVTNMRPDLFKAVVMKVPFVDIINTMLDEDLPLTIGEYEEWGNPNESEAYAYMKSYSPYDNLAAQDYPAMLVTTSLNDSQVMYWEPAKYVAKLRTLKTDQNPLLLKTNMGAGHGGASGRYDYLKEVAFDYAFMLGQVGITK